MGENVRKIACVILISGLWFAVGCGGSSNNGTGGGSSNLPTPTSTVTSTAGGTTPAPQGPANVAPLNVNVGPVSSSPQANVAFTTVTICPPASATCVTIPNIAVDTGSSGLRIPVTAFQNPAFANGAAVLAALQNVNTSTPVAECIQFLDNSFFWGTVKLADVKMGGLSNNSEVAGLVPIHVMGDTSIPTGTSIPSSCSMVTPTGGGSTIAGTEEDSVTALGANGLLGVGNYQYDCDVVGNPSAGVNACSSSSTPPAGMYYHCTGTTSCSASLVPAAQQVQNPVSKFTSDNNGVILELPAVPIGGQATASGSLVFGIGTQSNNGLSSGAVVLTIDSNENDAAWSGFTTTYNNVAYPNSISSIGSFLDSGSNGIYFLDQPTSKIPTCPIDSDFYCPSSPPDSLTAFNQASGSSIRSQVPFNVSAADTLFSGSNSAFSDLAGPNTPNPVSSSAQTADGYFDWGLPFFYGRNVYTAIWGAAAISTPMSGVSVPAGPFWAY